MIPKNKIDFCKTTDKTVYFFFQFIDGMFYWKYNHNQLTQLRLEYGGRYDRAKNEIKKYCYIPLALLEKLSQ